MLRIENCSKVYENGTIALEDVNLTFESKGMVAIVGTSGCGKSTLINLLSANDMQTGGELFYNDIDYNEFGKEMLINEFGYIYQDFKLIDNLTVYQNILLGQELATTGIDYDYLIEIADELGITDILDNKVYSLSGGQMQRVAIARAIVRRPKVIFADEPTGNLDSYNSINVYNILRDLADDILVVIVTHDTEITKWADRVITLEDGKVVSDNPNIPNFEEKELSTEEVREEDDIQEILLKQKAIKGKKINAFFSYKKQPKATQNVARLSGKSSLGLSISLLNKDVVKKIFLTIVMVLLIALMTLSTSMSFATTEKTMANAINMSAKGKKIFGLEVFVENMQKSITLKDISEMDRLLEENNLNFYKVGTGEVIADSWKNMQIANSEAVDTAYYINMNVANIENAIFVDNPTEIGVDIILGKAPASQNEIAISKSYYDYLLHYKKFKVNVREIDYEITFDKDILGKTITPFNIVISGVFDDKNAIDEKRKTKTIDSLNATQKENLVKEIKEERDTNVLINTIIKCKASENDWYQFAGVNTDLKITIKDCWGFQNPYYFNYMPYNNATKNYFNFALLGIDNVADDEIIIDRETLGSINEYFKKIGEGEKGNGDTIDLSIVEMETNQALGSYYPIKSHKDKQFRLRVLDSIDGVSKTFIMSQNSYDELKAFGRYSNRRIIATDSVSSSQLTKINKGINKHFESVFNGWSKSGFIYSIKNCPIKISNDYGFIGICREYVSLPMIIVTIAMTIGIIVVFYSDFIKTKAKDLLILKSLGAKNKDFLKIYGIFSVVLILIQLLFGMIIGSVLIYCINIFASSISGYAKVFSVFYLDTASIVFCFAMILLINVVSLIIGLAGINNKNLRKAFQKLKK